MSDARTFGTRLFASRSTIEDAVRRIASEIDRDHPDEPPLLAGVLRGSLPFLADLARACRTNVEVDLLAISSFGQEARQGGVVRILKDLDTDIQGRAVVLVEDIVDQGLTLRYLTRMLSARGPAALRVATLLDRPSARTEPIALDYVGLRVDEGYVVGYGLDAGERLRNLRNLWILEPGGGDLDDERIARLHAEDARTSG
jgi:hypoxanthine phosphoribosyltransferase